MKLRSKVIAIVVLLASCPVSAAQWYEGGTLHSAIGAQWHAASDSNRLATSGDFIAGIRNRLTMKIKSMNEVKAMAHELSACITEATTGPGASQPVSDMAAACVILMGWVKGDQP